MATVLIAAPTDNEEIDVPFNASGSATAAAGRTIVALEWQIDGNTPTTLNPPPPASAAGGTIAFAFTITDSDCPDPATWYMLNVYCWEDNGDLVIESRAFSRKAEIDIGDDTLGSGGVHP